jgi:hypothetical protein
MKTLIIDKQKFLEWYNADVDFTADVMHHLMNYGHYKVSVNDLLDDIGYVPEWVLVEGQKYKLYENGDVDVRNVSLKFNS